VLNLPDGQGVQEAWIPAEAVYLPAAHKSHAAPLATYEPLGHKETHEVLLVNAIE